MQGVSCEIQPFSLNILEPFLWSTTTYVKLGHSRGHTYNACKLDEGNSDRYHRHGEVPLGSVR